MTKQRKDNLGLIFGAWRGEGVDAIKSTTRPITFLNTKDGDRFRPALSINSYNAHYS